MGAAEGRGALVVANTNFASGVGKFNTSVTGRWSAAPAFSGAMSEFVTWADPTNTQWATGPGPIVPLPPFSTANGLLNRLFCDDRESGSNAAGPSRICHFS
jgi:hypothetical protein